MVLRTVLPDTTILLIPHVHCVIQIYTLYKRVAINLYITIDKVLYHIYISFNVLFSEGM